MAFYAEIARRLAGDMENLELTSAEKGPDEEATCHMGIWETGPVGDGAPAKVAEEAPHVLPEGITAEEWHRIARIYKDIDTDGNGSLDAWEIRAAVGGDSEGLFALLDANHDDEAPIAPSHVLCLCLELAFCQL